MLLDRSGQGKVYQLISRRRFQQMEVLEGQNILVTISGKKNRVRVYYLSWLKSKILRTDGHSDVSFRFICIEGIFFLTRARARVYMWYGCVFILMSIIIILFIYSKSSDVMVGSTWAICRARYTSK